MVNFVPFFATFLPFFATDYNSYSSYSQPPGLFSLAWAGGDSDDPEVPIQNNKQIQNNSKIVVLLLLFPTVKS